MRNSQRLGIAGAAALGLFGFVGIAGAADIGPEGYYAPAPRYSVPAEEPYVQRRTVEAYEPRRRVEVEADGQCRTYVRRSVDPYGRERVRRVEDCDEGRSDGYYRRRYDEDAEPYAAPPRPPVPVDPDDGY